MAVKNLNDQAKEIMKIAEESGVQSNFFFEPADFLLVTADAVYLHTAEQCSRRALA